jgi:hypothetical protein
LVPLQSELFRDDAALQACLVKDAAHIVKGARGQHVAKIQSALGIIEGALIDSDELANAFYGPSTASEVLAYKRKRDIVNRTYQQRADDIVGKMTIASLDREILEGEQRPSPKSCQEPVKTGGAAGVAVRSQRRQSLVGDTPQPQQPQQFPAILSVLFQVVSIRGKQGPQSFAIAAETLRRANELTVPLGMSVRRIIGIPFDFSARVKFDSSAQIEGLRRAAEKAMPGFEAAVRVLICPLFDADGDADLETNAISTSAVDENKKPFKRFIVINSHLLRKDRGTLLHEMIHCSDESLMGEIGVHDLDGSAGIFSWDAQRTKLFPERATALRNAFFAFKR